MYSSFNSLKQTAYKESIIEKEKQWKALIKIEGRNAKRRGRKFVISRGCS